MVRLEIIKAFGFTIYDYESKFHHCKQGDESFRQYVLKLQEYLSKMCDICGVDRDYERLHEMMIKYQIIHSVSRNFSEYLRERDVFNMNLEDMINFSDNFQAIHGKTGGKSKHCHSDSNTEPSYKLCYHCNKPGHLARSCKLRVGCYVGPTHMNSKPCGTTSG